MYIYSMTITTLVISRYILYMYLYDINFVELDKISYASSFCMLIDGGRFRL